MNADVIVREVLLLVAWTLLCVCAGEVYDLKRDGKE